MAHRKAGGSTKNLRDSKPNFLGVKCADGQTVKPGEIIVRQRGTRYNPGKNVRLGKDHTIFAVRNGIVSFSKKQHQSFEGKNKQIKVIDVK
jgi:large subunit ribosomal protein L27